MHAPLYILFLRAETEIQKKKGAIRRGESKGCVVILSMRSDGYWTEREDWGLSGEQQVGVAGETRLFTCSCGELYTGRNIAPPSH